jgi:hypothetical protein
MATSGTVGTTTILVDDLISHSLRRAGVSASDVTSEIQQTAKNNLYFYLCTLANKGWNLWAIDRTVIGLVQGQKEYALPVGTVDIINALYRTVSLPSGGTAYSSAGGTADNAFDQDITTSCTQTAPNGYISYQWSDAVTITGACIMANGTATYSLVFEYSLDGVTWATSYTASSQSYADRTWVSFDFDPQYSAAYFRVRETGGATLNLREVIFAQSPSQIPMARMNINDYSNQINQTFQQREALQYYFKRDRVQPRMLIWPTAGYSFDQIEVWRTRAIQDVGSLTNEVEVPARQYEALVCELAKRMIMEIPNADLSRVPILQAMAAEATGFADDEERDNSPINWTPDIGVYTRR